MTNIHKTIFFTLCSNNYLAMAKTLGYSVKKIHPESRFVIGLVDRKIAEIDYSIFHGDVIPVETLYINAFDRMQLNYNIIELNTSVKPYYFRYLFDQYPEIETIVYLDPDTFVFHPMDSILPSGESDLVVLTPHISKPIPLDDKYPDENLVLNHGIYNLGFLALRRSDTANLLLNWWSERMTDRCKIDLKNGMFTDQLYMNLVPLFFNEVRIEKNMGLNVAFWNLHYRVVSFRDDQWMINSTHPLILYHFSGFVMNDEFKISKGATRFVLENGSDLKKLFDEYRKLLISNNWTFFQSKKPYFVTSREQYLHDQYWNKLKKHPVLYFVHYIKKMIPDSLFSRFLNMFRYSNY